VGDFEGDLVGGAVGAVVDRGVDSLLGVPVGFLCR